MMDRQLQSLSQRNYQIDSCKIVDNTVIILLEQLQSNYLILNSPISFVRVLARMKVPKKLIECRH